VIRDLPAAGVPAIPPTTSKPRQPFFQQSVFNSEALRSGPRSAGLKLNHKAQDRRAARAGPRCAREDILEVVALPDGAQERQTARSTISTHLGKIAACRRGSESWSRKPVSASGLVSPWERRPTPKSGLSLPGYRNPDAAGTCPTTRPGVGGDQGILPGRRSLSQSWIRTNSAEREIRAQAPTLGASDQAVLLAKRRGFFEVRDVHPDSLWSCMALSRRPKDRNIGLSRGRSRPTRASTNTAFIETPYREVREQSRLTDRIVYLSAPRRRRTKVDRAGPNRAARYSLTVAFPPRKLVLGPAYRRPRSTVVRRPEDVSVHGRLAQISWSRSQHFVDSVPLKNDEREPRG